MPKQRIHTADLEGLLRTSVPGRAIRRTGDGWLVVYRSIVLVSRSGEGWVALVCAPPPSAAIGVSLEQLVSSHPIEEHAFVTVDEAVDLCERLWPFTDETVTEMLAELEDVPLTEAEELRLAEVLERSGIRGEGEDGDG